jgi:hypothetical protein
MCEPVTMAAIGTAAASAAASVGTAAAAAGTAIATAASGITLAGAATAATIAGGVISAGGAIMQGQAQAKQAKYQSAVERNNATIAGWQAQDATQRGQIEEQRQRLATARLHGAQRAGMAANGVEVGAGSSLDVLMDTAQLGELDALTIRSNAEREAYGLRNQQSNLTAQSALTSMAGKNARTASYISAGSTLLSTAATAGDRAATYKRYGQM